MDKIQAQPRSRREEFLQEVPNLRYLDDIFLSSALKDPETIRVVLEAILERPILIRRVETQFTESNLYGRGVRLDVLAEFVFLDGEGQGDRTGGQTENPTDCQIDNQADNHTATVSWRTLTGEEDFDGENFDAEQSKAQASRFSDVEVQIASEGADPRRLRFNASMLDKTISERGSKYRALPDTYIIFITEDDLFKRGLPVYHVDRVIRELGEIFEDGQHILYVNSRCQTDTPLGRLMHDFHCRNADEMYTKELADRMRKLKSSQMEVDSMCSVVEKIKRESLEEGIALGEARGMKRGMKLGEERGMRLGEERGVQRGAENAKREIVRSMYKTQMPLEVIAQICDMPVSKVRHILSIN